MGGRIKPESVAGFAGMCINPTFMIIGINPGGGYRNTHGVEVEDFQLKNKKNEFIEEDYNIAKNTRRLFSELGNIRLLSEAVITNHCFIATESVEDLNRLRKIINNEMGIDFFQLSNKWIKQIIDYSVPKIILCAGFDAYDKIVRLYEIKKNSSKKFKKYTNVKYCLLNNGVFILGYRRHYSTIPTLSREQTIEILKIKLKAFQQCLNI